MIPVLTNLCMIIGSAVVVALLTLEISRRQAHLSYAPFVALAKEVWGKFTQIALQLATRIALRAYRTFQWQQKETKKEILSKLDALTDAALEDAIKGNFITGKGSHSGNASSQK